MSNFKSITMNISLAASIIVLVCMVTVGRDKYVCIDDCVNTMHTVDEPSGTAFIVEFEGPVMEMQTSIFMSKLAKVREQAVKGDRIILTMTSPGGSMVLGNRVWSELQSIKRDGIAIIGVTESHALSAGYLIVSASHAFYSTDGALIGNVGVYNKVQIAKKTDVVVIGSSRTKELFGGDGVRSKEDIDMLKGRIKDMNTLFRTRILETRAGKIKNINKAFDGTPYDSRQAIKLGLSDGHASVRDIVATAVLNDYNIKHVFSRRDVRF